METVPVSCLSQKQTTKTVKTQKPLNTILLSTLELAPSSDPHLLIPHLQTSTRLDMKHNPNVFSTKMGILDTSRLSTIKQHLPQKLQILQCWRGVQFWCFFLTSIRTTKILPTQTMHNSRGIPDKFPYICIV